ncbi:MAG: hypothetical protein QOI98_3072, partial [Solirubrobacteraceae bacterium]|nr:hypothetical protein [Solirubrobacteraceae bacterium]
MPFSKTADHLNVAGGIGQTDLNIDATSALAVSNFDKASSTKSTDGGLRHDQRVVFTLNLDRRLGAYTESGGD